MLPILDVCNTLALQLQAGGALSSSYERCTPLQLQVVHTTVATEDAIHCSSRQTQDIHSQVILCYQGKHELVLEIFR